MSQSDHGLRKQTTLYDAVAGRVGYEGFLTEPETSRYRDTASSTQVPIPPEEALFRRKNAPARYAEDDIYEADRHLQPHQKLPDSDLLKAVHAYVADFFAANVDASKKLDERSMDETALLAIGILLEEAAAASLGKTGDLALVESSKETYSTRDDSTYWSGARQQQKVVTAHRTGRRSMSTKANNENDIAEVAKRD